MEERFRPLTFHGLILRSQLVTLLDRGVCYSESQSVSPPLQKLQQTHPCLLRSLGTVFMGCQKEYIYFYTLRNACVFLKLQTGNVNSPLLLLRVKEV